jgi:nicotinamide-nucleotide amidase
MFTIDQLAAAAALLEACHRDGLKLVTAESCTGGLIAGCLTAIPGSSNVFDRGFVVYSNRAKQELLGVPGRLLAAHGAVSEEVARAMAEGAVVRSIADIAVAVTGVAGPGGGTPEKPVGLVHIAAAGKGRPTLHERREFDGDRATVRAQSVDAAFKLLMELVGG